MIGSVQDVRQLDRMTAMQDRFIDSTSRRNMYLFITPFKFAHKLRHFTVMKFGGQSSTNKLQGT